MPSVLITGAGRRAGIAAACAVALAQAGWDVGISHWRPYDRDQPPPSRDDEPCELLEELRSLGARAEAAEIDLAEGTGPLRLFEELASLVGPFSALVVAHCRDLELPLMRTTADEFDRHFAVNARSVALLIQEFARRLPGSDGRIVAFTSDALADNVPYGVTKRALDGVIQAAALELGPRGIRANSLNPGPTDTGGISDDVRRELSDRSPLRRIGMPEDSAHLVSFLLSPDAAWITGQVLRSDGGLR